MSRKSESGSDWLERRIMESKCKGLQSTKDRLLSPEYGFFWNNLEPETQERFMSKMNSLFSKPSEKKDIDSWKQQVEELENEIEDLLSKAEAERDKKDRVRLASILDEFGGDIKKAQSIDRFVDRLLADMDGEKALRELQAILALPPGNAQRAAFEKRYPLVMFGLGGLAMGYETKIEREERERKGYQPHTKIEEEFEEKIRAAIKLLNERGFMQPPVSTPLDLSELKGKWK